MINLTGPLSSRRTEKKERDKKREREKENLCRAIISSCVDYCLAEAKLKNAALAPRQPHRSSCSVSSTEWNSLLTKEDKFFSVRDLEARTRTNEIYSLLLCLFSFLSYLSLFSPCSPCPSARMSRCEQYASQAPLSSGFACILLECATSFSIQSPDTFPDPQKTSYAQNLISFSRVTRQSPGRILRRSRRTFCSSREKKRNVQHTFEVEAPGDSTLGGTRHGPIIVP